MIFLIDYDRDEGHIVFLKPFQDRERQAAEDARLELELKFNEYREKREIVLLQARNEQALRKTHRRYFENLEELVKSERESQV